MCLFAGLDSKPCVETTILTPAPKKGGGNEERAEQRRKAERWEEGGREGR
jgi:hypothetical protein